MSEATDLQGVPETALWTLHHRAAEARRTEPLMVDPVAVDLIERIDFPFAERFGSGFQGLTQMMALRVACFDGAVSRFLDGHPRGTVVALGEGLETQFWRVDNGEVRWLTVDLPASAEMRRRLLPPGPRQRIHAGSALEPAWMEAVDPENGVLITAQGLLMYMEPNDAHTLIARCAQRFPGAAMVLDTVPRWMSRAVTRANTRAAGYRPPPMPWCVDSADWPRLRDIHPNIVEVAEMRLPRGRGLLGWLAPWLHLVPVLPGRRGGVVRLRFGLGAVA
jgi:O-methyltransferase involved in polyketide biosynthesis